LVEMEVRELLSSQEFPGDDVPVIKVSALKALEGDPEWVKAIEDLMEAVDENVPEPKRDIDKTFLMPSEDAFTITGRGAVVPEMLYTVNAAATVGRQLRRTKREDVDGGQVRGKPGSSTPHTHCDTQVYILAKDESGRHHSCFSTSRPQFYSRSSNVTGFIGL